MAVNLLIDTVILKRLISRKEFSRYLTQLKFIVAQNHVNLLVPDVLIAEWKKHREEEKKKLETDLKGDKMSAKLSGLFKDTSAEFKQEKIDEAMELLLSQIETIDDLLNHKGIHIARTGDLLMKVQEQRDAGKMPFRLNKKKDNTNDGILIFSALDYLTQNNENLLFFVTDNSDDFAATSVDSYVLHPEITDKFPTVVTQYFTHIEDVYKVFDTLNIPRFRKSEQKSNRIKNTITIDTTKSILHQIHEYLNKRFDELAYIPKRLFAEHYPFIKSEVFNYTHLPYTLITDNEELFNILTSLKIDNDNVTCKDQSVVLTEEDIEKARIIFRILFQNRITRIAFKDGQPLNLVYVIPDSQCNCPACQFKRIDWHDIIENKFIQDPIIDNPSVTQIRQMAYGQYKVGNYYQASKLLFKIYDESNEEKSLTRYIIGFNLKHLAPILSNHYWDDAEVTALAQLAFDIDLDKLVKDCTTSENKYIIQWLHSKTFTSETLIFLNQKVIDITDLFYSQSTGHNEYVQELSEEYGHVDGFLNRNYIIYDYYLEFQTLTELYIQGLLACYGWNPMIGGRISSLDDYWLIKLLCWGKADVIQKYLVRYKIKEIIYKPTYSPGKTFIDIIRAFSSNYHAIESVSQAHHQELSRFFWDKYSEIVYNAITLLSMIRLEKEVFNKAVLDLLDLLKQENHLSYFRLLKHLRFLFTRKKEEFNDECLIAFYKVCIYNRQFHSDKFFEILTDILEQRKMSVELTEKEFEPVHQNFLNELETEYAESSWIAIAYIYSTLKSNEQKTSISARVNSSLEENFKADRYYIARMFEIVPSDINRDTLYGGIIEVIIKEGKKPRFFATKDYYTDIRIDNYLNYSWKFASDMPLSIVGRAKNLSDYYWWLFDMDDFNYSLFNPEWLYNHFTVYFKRKFRQCVALKQYLLNFIKKNPNTELERIFMMIYCYED